jgi:hypothetical protein
MNASRHLSYVVAFLVSTSPLLAGLLGVNPSFPRIAFTSANSDSLIYDPASRLFSIQTTPSSVLLGPGQPPKLVTGTKSLVIRARVDDTGAWVEGVVGDDFVLTGTVVNGGTTYSGVLLSGEVVAFGFLESGATDQYDVRLSPAGGHLLSFFATGASVYVTSNPSTFAGSFTVGFTGRSNGTLGFEPVVTDTTPPLITCPADVVVECNANSEGEAGAFVTYPAVSVTDETDPTPTVVLDPASGSFFALPDGQASASYTVTATATDASGNSSTCTFQVTVQDTVPPAFDPEQSPILNACADPIALPNDPGTCHATYTFSLPVGLDACLPEPTPVPVTVSAGNENLEVIPLTDLGNGQFQGQFPVNPTGHSVITFVANDGHGNTTQAQCLVVVSDAEPPALVCTDQTGTFKPILTRAVSSINGRFGCNEITAGNTIWFNSVIHTPSDRQAPFTIRAYDQTIELSVDGVVTTIPVPEAYVTISGGVVTAMTTFVDGKWETVTKPYLPGNTFLSGVAYTVSEDIGGCRSRNCRYSECHEHRRHRRHVSATWNARFDIDQPGVFLRWGWAAAVYTQFSQDYTALGVKPVDGMLGHPYPNRDAAGSPENFKEYITTGARGDGRWCKWGRNDKYTGELTVLRRANLGVGSVCLGPVVFDPPLVSDNCDQNVTVTCTPASGSILGPGDHVITCVATDASGNGSQCTFTLTVLSPLQVVFDSPCDDNVNDNTRHEDDGYNDFNAPDDPSTPQILNRFSVGDHICHAVRLLDCSGQDVTVALSGAVTVHLDVTEREGEYASSALVADVTEEYVGTGSAGGLMIPDCGRFKYCLDTTGYSPSTVENTVFYRSTVWVEYNSSPGVPVGMEDVILESR